jgi:hypothetical protein
LVNYLLVLLAIFADYRLSELIALDVIFTPLREAAGKRVTIGKHDVWWWIAEWMNCPYCLGIWFALPLAFLCATGWQYILLSWIAIAGGQTFLESLSNRE